MHKKRIWLTLILITGFAGHALAEEATQSCASTATVVSTIDSGSYTYAQLDIGGSNVWYAVPATELKPGEQVFPPAGMLMKNFYSKTLDRTFETVYFAEGIQPAGAEAGASTLPPGHPPIASGLPAGHPPIQGSLPPGHPAIGTGTTNSCCPTNTPTSD